MMTQRPRQRVAHKGPTNGAEWRRRIESIRKEHLSKGNLGNFTVKALRQLASLDHYQCYAFT